MRVTGSMLGNISSNKIVKLANEDGFLFCNPFSGLKFRRSHGSAHYDSPFTFSLKDQVHP